DAGAGRDHRHHRSPAGHAGHEVQRHRDAGELRVPVAPGDDVVEEEREHQREEEEAGAAKRPQELIAGVGGGPAHLASSTPTSPTLPKSVAVPGAVSSRKACSSPAPVTSMSRASG